MNSFAEKCGTGVVIGIDGKPVRCPIHLANGCFHSRGGVNPAPRCEIGLGAIEAESLAGHELRAARNRAVVVGSNMPTIRPEK